MKVYPFTLKDFTVYNYIIIVWSPFLQSRQLLQNPS